MLNKPNQLVKGPGITGRKLPIIPVIINKNEINQENEKLYGCKGCHSMVLPNNKANQVCTGDNCTIEEVDKDGIGIEQVFQ